MTTPHMISRGAEPLAVYEVNDSYILGVYQGSLSDYDLLLKYRQRINSGINRWSNIRTPKHIHWAVDVMLKMSQQKRLTKSFLKFLLEKWDNTNPITSIYMQTTSIDSVTLLNQVEAESTKFEKLSKQGEYSVKFLLLMAHLLMIQEKTNRSDAYMFKDLLESLKEGQNIWKIVSTATHR